MSLLEDSTILTLLQTNSSLTFKHSFQTTSFKETSIQKQTYLYQGFLGGMNWKLLFGAFFCWIIIYCCIAKGVQLTGKVAMFTVIAPYFMFIVLIVRTMFLDGSWEGISYLFTFEYTKILSPKTWYRALDQNFFQHGIGSGYIFCFATFRKYNERIWRSSVLLIHKNPMRQLYIRSRWGRCHLWVFRILFKTQRDSYQWTAHLGTRLNIHHDPCCLVYFTSFWTLDCFLPLHSGTNWNWFPAWPCWDYCLLDIWPEAKTFQPISLRWFYSSECLFVFIYYRTILCDQKWLWDFMFREWILHFPSFSGHCGHKGVRF